MKLVWVSGEELEAGVAEVFGKDVLLEEFHERRVGWSGEGGEARESAGSNGDQHGGENTAGDQARRGEIDKGIPIGAEDDGAEEEDASKEVQSGISDDTFEETTPGTGGHDGSVHGDVSLRSEVAKEEEGAGVIIVDDDDLDPIEAVDVEEGGLLHQGEEYFGVDVPVEGEDYYQMYVPE